MANPRYSLVIPVYDEEETLSELFKRLSLLFDRLDGPAEVILVDDRSRDGSYSIMTAHAQRDPRYRVVRLSRNFGHQIAITAGLDFASGDAVVIMDADLQDPPELILEMAERWKEGYEVVYAVRGEREGESSFKRVTAKYFYRVMNKLTDVDAPLDAGDFRLVDRKALEAFRSLRENNRFVRGMFSWIGFNQTGVTYNRPQRFAGKTKFPLRKMLKFAVDGIVSFSNLPLRLALNLGFILSGLAFVGALAAVILQFSGTYLVPGWASLVVVTAFLGGIQLMILGVMGEYMARIYDEVKDRPLYVISDLHNVDQVTAPRRAYIGLSSATPTKPQVERNEQLLEPPS